ncbi:MAG TPA: patatin-like phospholipase family protein [Caulobacteraceae bacterium]|nr:patatin-like phospholipase family protein [Caulobacteraceae bacterium]
MTPDVFDTPSDTRRILAIDGGGMRGALAVGIIARLEETLRQTSGRPDLVLSDYFDLIGGTSTGSIIAAGLALGQDAAYLRELYHRLGPIVFAGGGAPRIPLLQSKFDPRKLGGVIQAELGDATLETAAWKTGFAAIAKRVDTGSSWVLTNCPHAKFWNGDPAYPDATPNRDYSLSKIVQASAAAPFYFDTVTLEVIKGEPGVFFDGAMTPHNNPALQMTLTALAPAYGFNWTPGEKNLLVVSVGTGQARPVKPGWVSQPVVLPVWKAIHALTSLAYDSSQLGISMMQWLGASPQPWRINSEIDGLQNSLPCPEALWTFVRYDAPIEKAWLKTHLGEDFTDAQIAKLGKMDDDTMVPELYRVGRKAGWALIKPEHFDGFEPRVRRPETAPPSPRPKRTPAAASRRRTPAPSSDSR